MINLSAPWLSPLFCFTVFAIIWGIGDMIAVKTKGYISGLIVASTVYLVGFLSGIFPSAITNSAGAVVGTAVTNSLLFGVAGGFGIAILITNMGTMIDLKQLIAEWKTVVVALVALLGVAAVSFTVSTWIFGAEYALSAASPIAGGTIAGVLTDQAAQAAGKPEFGVFAMLCVAFQMFIGAPVASACLKIEAKKFIKAGVVPGLDDSISKKKFSIRFIPALPEKLNTPFVILAKLSIVAVLANLLSIAIPQINVNISYLILGILFYEFGFLDKNSLTKANANGFFMLALMSACVASFASVNFTQFCAMIVPLVGCLLLGACGAMLFGVVAGKLLGWGLPLSFAISVTCMLGYPATQVVTDEVCKTLDCDKETAAKIKAYFLPKMIVGGFTTVTVASVAFAGIVAPMIFK